MMLKVYFSFIKRIVFWMLVFASARAVFLIYHIGLLRADHIGLRETLASFWYAIPLDIATACYLMIIPFLLTLIYAPVRKRIIPLIDKIYMAAMISIFFLVAAGELGIYSEWRTKLTFKALLYLKNPGEIYQSAATGTFFLLVGLWLAEVGFWYFIYHQFFRLYQSGAKFKLLQYAAFFIGSSVLLFIGLRGGVDAIPINQSKSFYSQHNILNHAAVNTTNSFMISTIENFQFKNENPFKFMDQKVAEEIVKGLHEVKTDTTISILKTQRPNIVVVLLEGWSADAIESCGGGKGITPQFQKLEQEGVLFTQLYASGNRSDQGNVAVLSGFPATPIISISHIPAKSQKLPSLVRVLKNEGYASSYYFGGQLIYGGIKSFVMSAGFDKVYEMSDFEDQYPRGKLGIHDEYMLPEQLRGLSEMREPFFSMIFTVSSHSPYDFPRKRMIPYASLENEYLNSVHYADSCLGMYFERARTMPWFKNTLFVIVSDHSHMSQFNWHVLSKEYRRIPLLLAGEVIKDEYRGTQQNRISGQTDIAATLLHQLGIPADDFTWSRNLFNPYTREFAFYEATEGAGWVSPDGYFVYRREMDKYLESEILPANEQAVITDGKAYLQVLFQQYLDY
jgi:phosphoglycerol transferase MdoB-like AlkP superfamily enzyme